MEKKETETFENQNPAAEDYTPPSIVKGIVDSPSKKVVYIGAKCGMPFMRMGAPADGFRKLRKVVIEATGYDFLGTLADAMRAREFKSNKLGVSTRSRHKCGDAFDIDQTNPKMVVVHEPQGLQSFFRVWLECKEQDGSQGVNTTLTDVRGFQREGWFFDFTAAAERIGWRRIPAWNGWTLNGSGYNLMEFWHYQLTEGLTFDEAMKFLYANNAARTTSVRDVRTSPVYKVLGLNDRGAAVRNLQEKLSKLGFLSREEIDGVYGKVTQNAVKTLQEKYGLDADGLVGPETRQLIDTLIK